LADFDRNFLLINQAYAEFAEVEEKDVIGTSSLGNSWLPKEIIAKNLSKVREVIENKEVIVRERMINPGRSDESYWDVTKFPVFNDQGDVVAVGGIGMDITEQKKVEQSVRLSDKAAELERGKLQPSIDSLQECFAYFNQDKKLVNFNKSSADRYSYLKEN